MSYSNPTRKFLKNDRVASSVYFSHFREIAARPASQYYSHMNTALVRSPMSFDHKKSNHYVVVIMEVLSFISSLSSATSKTQTYFQHINVFMMLLTIIITMVMIRNITAVMIITKYSLPTVDFATRYSTRYSDFLLQPYSNPTRSQKRLLVGPWSSSTKRLAHGFLLLLNV